MPKISVIIPVYNTKEEYLRESIESIINQSFIDFEIVIVDDGSTNNAKEVIFSYKDERIKYFYQENQGLGGARNTGIRQAQGEYILFLDSDDWIDSKTLEKTWNKSREFDSDLLLFGVNVYDDKTKETKIFDDLSIFDNDLENISFDIKNSKMLNKIFSINNSSCAKLFKRDFLLKNNLFFVQELLFEDTEFFFRYIFLAEKISILKEILYFYRRNTNYSLTTNNEKKYTDMIFILPLIQKALIENDCFYKLKIIFYRYKFIMLQNIYNRIDAESKKIFINEIKKDFKTIKIKFTEFHKFTKEQFAFYCLFLNKFNYFLYLFIFKLSIYLKKIKKFFILIKLL